MTGHASVRGEGGRGCGTVDQECQNTGEWYGRSKRDNARGRNGRRIENGMAIRSRRGMRICRRRPREVTQNVVQRSSSGTAQRGMPAQDLENQR